jgi:hypothetical protein
LGLILKKYKKPDPVLKHFSNFKPIQYQRIHKILTVFSTFTANQIEVPVLTKKHAEERI